VEDVYLLHYFDDVVQLLQVCLLQRKTELLAVLTSMPCSHTSQDSYTTFMRQAKGLDNAAASRASIWMKVGACVGGCIIGYLSQFIGRRRAMIGSALSMYFSEQHLSSSVSLP
jgi:hypothetical protein